MYHMLLFPCFSVKILFTFIGALISEFVSQTPYNMNYILSLPIRDNLSRNSGQILPSKKIFTLTGKNLTQMGYILRIYIKKIIHVLINSSCDSYFYYHFAA